MEAARRLSRVCGLGRSSSDGWALLAIVVLVLVANALYLLDFSDINPLGPRGSLAATSVSGWAGGQPTIDPNNGFVSQALGHRAALDLVHLHLPWWNPFEGTGAPLAAENQSAALFPPTLLALLSNGQLYEHVLLELIAGLATYCLLRGLSVNRWASLAGGSAFALNGTFAWLAHAPVNPVALLPVLLIGIERAGRASQDQRHGGWRLIAVAGALSFYAGFPETAYIDTALAAAWFLWRLGTLTPAQRRRFAVKGLLGAVVGILLAAPLLIASVGYINHTDLGGHTSDFYGSAHIPSQGLSQLLLPYVYGPIFGFSDPNGTLTTVWDTVGGYLSTVLLALGAVGIGGRHRRGLRIALGIWILLVLARMYGQVPLLGHVLGWLPGMSRLAFFRYATPALELAVIVLAALGIEDLMRAPRARRRAVAAVLGSLLLVGAAALEAHPLTAKLGPHYSSRHYFAFAVAWGVLTLLALAACAWPPTPRRRGSLLAVIVALDALVLFAGPELSAPRAVTVDAAPAAYLSRHLGEQRFFTLGPLQPNYGSYYGISSLNINDVPIPAQFASYAHTRLDQYVDPTVLVGTVAGGRSTVVPSPAAELLRNLDGYRAAGVAYVLTPTGMALGQNPAAFTLVDRTPTTLIYHLAGASSFFTASDCRLRSANIDAATLNCRQATTLIRRETDLPGWSVQIDGQSARVGRSQGLFQSVSVPAGRHVITFAYAPPGIIWGWLGLAAGLAALTVATWRPGLRLRLRR